jgi:hypothetical protein
MVKKGNLALNRLVDGRDSVNDDIAVASDLPSNLASKLIEGFTERHLFFHPAVVTLDDFARDVDSLVAIENLRAF